MSRRSLLPPLADLDYRFLLLGSVLPDLIDKPLGQLLLRTAFSSGRILGHTLILNVLGLAVAMAMWRHRGRAGPVWLMLGSLAHLVLDQLWLMPRTLFWPALGWSFERLDLSGWVPSLLDALVSEPAVFIPEIAGGVALGLFALSLIRRRRVGRFIRTGTD